MEATAMRALAVLIFCSLLSLEVAAARLAFRESDDESEQTDVIHSERKAVKKFDPVACNRTWVPYQRMWDEKPTTAGKFKVPHYDLPMMCEGHSVGAPFLLIAANGHNKTTPQWLSKLHGIPYEVYHAEDEKEYHHFANVANEAGAYLTYIVEHYDCLPDVTLFVHSHNDQSWHRTETLEHSLQKMRMTNVNGFALLHKTGAFDWVALRHPRRNLDGHEAEDQHRSDADCGDVVNGTLYQGMDIMHLAHSDWINEAWDIFLGPAGLGPVPEMLRFSVGAEFLVSRDRIRARPRKFYSDAISFMAKYPEAYPGRLNGYFLGAVWESVWHVVFGMDSHMKGRNTPACDLFVCD